jgi:UDP-glucuronate decarboxylase
MQRILITGGAGFIGSHLCERLLSSGFRVVCLDNLFTGSRENIAHLMDNPHFEFIRHDVTRPLVVEVDQIFHLACPASPVHYQRNPVRTIETAVHGTLNLLNLARDMRARILLTSTSEVYGDPQQHPQTESYWGHVNPIGARACYDEGKRCAEAMAVAYAKQYGVEVRIARVFNTYGPRMREDDGRVISNLIIQALRGDDLTIYGQGEQTRSFCYVDDLVDALIRLMNQDSELGPVNLGNPNEITIRELADRVLRMTGSSSSLRFLPLPEDDPTRRRPDITRARKLLGWSPSTSIDRGLAATIRYFSERAGGRSNGRRNHGSRVRREAVLGAG